MKNLTSNLKNLFPKMRLFSAGLILLCVTLFCQLGFLAALSWQLASAEHDIWLESRAKSVAFEVGSVLRYFYQATTMLMGYALTHNSIYSAGYDRSLHNFQRQADFAWTMVKLSPDVKTPGLVEEARGLTSKAMFALGEVKRTLDSRPKNLSIADLTGVGGGVRDVIEQYFNVLSVVALEEAKGREQKIHLQNQARHVVKALMVIGFALNVGISLGILWFWLNGVTKRLDVIVQNARRLGERKDFLPVLEGRDEIAEVDRVFHDVYAKLKDSDELKQQFVSLISHELRSPLTSITATLTLAETGVYGDLNERGLDGIRKAGLSSKRLLNLINELLDIHKMEAGKFQLHVIKTDLREIIEVSIEEVRPLAETKEITIESTCEDWQFVADPERLEQVIINLLSNAVKHSPTASKIVVETSVQEKFLEVKVSDQGPGITEEFQKKAFGKFEQAEGTTGGTGLGLFICKGIIEQHSGTIGVENRDTGGACFWFKIPIISQST